MRPEALRELLVAVAAGKTDPDAAFEALRRLPFEVLGEARAFARIDHHRESRTGFPEVVFAPGKTVEQLTEIIGVQRGQGSPVLVTRIDAGNAAAVLARVPGGRHHAEARALTFAAAGECGEPEGLVVVLSGGTSDIPVACEAALTAALARARVEEIYDVGVAGLHRLLGHLETLQRANVVVAAAGMDGALPAVVAGLVSCPVVGLPTSVGYGASAGGFAAMFTMLSSCAPGVAVVNIDNGFGAGYLAAAINRAASGGNRSSRADE
ncbi:MAG: nickel pincer cofactor biosynthesis protein LarB [Candidatus Schekmanbacteria bacterium]|nr:nickel pincer cofactor biosynthesis protein LarB [Candidatus Schekmanbacteria bacterium]